MADNVKKYDNPKKQFDESQYEILIRCSDKGDLTKGSLKNNFTFYTPMHPAWRRCESSEYPDIPAFSRLANRTPQRLKL